MIVQPRSPAWFAAVIVVAAAAVAYVCAPRAAPAAAPALARYGGAPGMPVPRILWTGGPPPYLTVDDYATFPRDTMQTSVQRLWRSRVAGPGVESADLVMDGGGPWLAQTCCASLPDSLRRVTFSCESVRRPGEEDHIGLSQVMGRAPSLARLGGNRWLLAVCAPRTASKWGVRVHTASARGDWSDGTWVGPPGGVDGAPHMAPSRLVHDDKQGWLLPVCYGTGDAQVVIHCSRDGTAWDAMPAFAAREESDPALAIAPDGSWVALTSRRGRFLRRISADGGRSWSGPDTLAFRTVDAGGAPGCGFALRAGGSPRRLWLAFPAPAPDTTAALPALQPLQLAASRDDGRTWSAAVPALVWPGRAAVQPALAFERGRVRVLAIDAAAGDSAGVMPGRYGRPVLAEWDADDLFAPAAWPRPDPKRGYALHAGAVHTTLRLLAAQTLARPPAPRRLFVEAYLARGLAAAAPVLESDADSHWFSSRQGLEHALAFADRLVLLQDKTGYWPLGYGAIFMADIGAAVGTFAALEPYADSARVHRWESAAVRFCDAMEQDVMILPSGAVGVGWVNTYIPRSKHRDDRKPYLVSTALAGVEVHAWLWNRTRNPKYRERALRALDWTLSQIQPDGALPAHTSGEGALTAAAYVEEGWMMLDTLWRDPEILLRLQAALPVHVRWLLQSQRPDGTWDGGADGEFARTPAIVNFLIWYDQRCRPAPELKRAVQRASRALSDPARWPQSGLFRAGYHHEVQRAHSLRALAAIATGRAVP